MSELTLAVMRLGLLIALWLFVFALAGVLRSDLYGTRITARRPRRAGRAAKAAASAPAQPPAAEGSGRGGFLGRGRSGPRKLVVTAGSLTGTSLPLRAQGTLIGRTPECALVLDDDYASGRHARIFQDDGQWYVEDLGSTNGTWLDDRRLGGEPQPVREGSVLRIGRTVLELRH